MQLCLWFCLQGEIQDNVIEKKIDKQNFSSSEYISTIKQMAKILRWFYCFTSLIHKSSSYQQNIPFCHAVCCVLKNFNHYQTQAPFTLNDTEICHDTLPWENGKPFLTKTECLGRQKHCWLILADRDAFHPSSGWHQRVDEPIGEPVLPGLKINGMKIRELFDWYFKQHARKGGMGACSQGLTRVPVSTRLGIIDAILLSWTFKFYYS